MKNIVCLVGLTLFLMACNDLATVTPAAVSPASTATLTLELLPTATRTPPLTLVPAAEIEPMRDWPATAVEARPFTFAHDNIRDVVYTEAGSTRRRLYHRQAFTTLEQAQAPAAELAFHAAAASLCQPAQWPLRRRCPRRTS